MPKVCVKFVILVRGAVIQIGDIQVFVAFVTFVKWSCYTNETNAASKTRVVHPPLFIDMEDRFDSKNCVCCEERKKGDRTKLIVDRQEKRSWKMSLTLAQTPCGLTCQWSPEYSMSSNR